MSVCVCERESVCVSVSVCVCVCVCGRTETELKRTVQSTQSAKGERTKSGVGVRGE